MLIPLPPYPAAMIKTRRTQAIVIADLHIGWEIALSKKGIHVPTQTQKFKEKLSILIEKYNPKTLLILGDVKHTVATAEKSEWHDVPDIFDWLKKQISEICIIRGNHDGNLEPLLPERIKLLPATGIALDDVGLFHGHKWPSPTLLKCRILVMGHIHPVVSFRDPSGFRISKQVWIKSECNTAQLTEALLKKHKLKIEINHEETLQKHYHVKPKTQQIFIMPSFNDFLGGKPLNATRLSNDTRKDMGLGPILRSQAVDMGKAETYLLDGTFLGTLQQLKALN